MNEQEYIEQRLEYQINWYSQKSQYNQTWFKRLRLSEIISATFIPFLSGMGDKVPCGPWLIGGLGVFIAVAAASGSLFKFHENWIQYRTTAEQLKHEKFLYLTGTKPYESEDKFSALVQRIEGLISKENSSWSQVVKKVGKTSDKA
ncbi:MAG: DUF4231 domain-containing protein [Candidatus Desantisbacteria bacterium]